MNNPTCCGQPAVIKEDNHNDIDGFGVVCNICNHAIFNEDRETAINDFSKGAKNIPEQKREVKKVVNNDNRSLVISPNNMASVFESRKEQLSIIASPILSGDKTAMERLMLNKIGRAHV